MTFCSLASVSTVVPEPPSQRSIWLDASVSVRQICALWSTTMTTAAQASATSTRTIRRLTMTAPSSRGTRCRSIQPTTGLSVVASTMPTSDGRMKLPNRWRR